MPCPRNNKNKTGSNAHPAKSKRNAARNHPGPMTGDGPLETLLPAQSSPGEEEDAWLVDEETVMFFLIRYQELEQALMRAGYTRASHTPGRAQPDWPRFARHIQPLHDARASEAVRCAAAFMLLDEDNLALREERLENAPPWENPDPHNDAIWLAELLQWTERKLFHGLNFVGTPGCDITMVTAALLIVDEWSRLDPEVEKLLGSHH